MRKALGRDEKTPQELIHASAQELQDMREIAWINQKPLAEVWAEINGGKIAETHAREAIFKQKRKI